MLDVFVCDNFYFPIRNDSYFSVQCPMQTLYTSSGSSATVCTESFKSVWFCVLAGLCLQTPYVTDAPSLSCVMPIFPSFFSFFLKAHNIKQCFFSVPNLRQCNIAHTSPLYDNSTSLNKATRRRDRIGKNVSRVSTGIGTFHLD